MPAETMISLLAATLLASGWAIWMMPVGQCRECPHCHAERLARQRADDARVGRYYGIPLCPACGRHHQPEDGHRS